MCFRYSDADLVRESKKEFRSRTLTRLGNHKPEGEKPGHMLFRYRIVTYWELDYRHRGKIT
jgi:hypothetical protein